MHSPYNVSTQMGFSMQVSPLPICILGLTMEQGETSNTNVHYRPYMSDSASPAARIQTISSGIASSPWMPSEAFQLGHLQPQYLQPINPSSPMMRRDLHHNLPPPAQRDIGNQVSGNFEYCSHCIVPSTYSSADSVHASFLCR